MVKKHKNYDDKYLLTLIFASIVLFSTDMFIHNVSADTVTATISGIGNTPLGVKVNPNTNTLYVANQFSSVSVIDGTTDSVVKTVPIVGEPVDVNVNPITNKIYVADSRDNIGSVIDGTTNNVVSTINLGTGLDGFAVNPKTDIVYITGAGYSIYVINGTTNALLTTVSKPGHDGFIAVNQNTNMIYATSTGYSNGPKGYLTIIDGTTNTIRQTMTLGIVGGGVAVNPTTNMIYVTDSGGHDLFVIDGITNSIMSTTSVGNEPLGVDVNPNTNTIYVANQLDNTVSVVNGAKNSVLSTIPVGTSPYGVSVNEVTNKVYVTNQGSNTVSVIDGSPPKSLPQAPTNLSINTISSSQINLSWTAPSNDGGSQITGYQIERSSDNNTSWSTIVSNTASNATDYSDTGLVHSATYSYRVSAINGIGPSQPSNVASATTFNVAPSSPTSLTATGKITHVDLTWTAPSDNGGTPILGYAIQRSTDNGTTWAVMVQNTNSTGTTYTDSHLIPVKAYSYQVFAINSVGISNSSNMVSTKPLSTPHLVSVSDKDEAHFK